MADDAIIAAYDSRNIVQDFLCYKLLRKGVAWKFNTQQSHTEQRNDPPPASSSRRCVSRIGVTLPPAGQECDPQQDSGLDSQLATHRHSSHHRIGDSSFRLQDTLRCAGDELERRHHGDLSKQTTVLLMRWNGSAHCALVAAKADLFGDGVVNWGRIVTLLELGGALCAQLANTDDAWQVDDIAGWMVDSLDSPHLQGWIEGSGGWDAFVELYSPSSASGFWSVRTTLGLAVLLGAAGIILGALFTQNYKLPVLYRWT
ncbi:apoptosis regulator Bcl-2-like [Genypterus blacodes]|uniref:apoptosis regulator Bcl-2-like n=1 Tax=Genypterus blacodes TaxID=154954 RepID=UPI003F75BF0E